MTEVDEESMNRQEGILRFGDGTLIESVGSCRYRVCDPRQRCVVVDGLWRAYDAMHRRTPEGVPDCGTINSAW